MKTYPPPSLTSLLTSLLLLTNTTVVLVVAAPTPNPAPIPVPVPAADPLIEYHTLPLAPGTGGTGTGIAATGNADRDMDDKTSLLDTSDDDSSIGARIHALLFGSSSGSFDKRRRTMAKTPTAAAAEVEVEVLASEHFDVDQEKEEESEDWENWHSQWRRQQQLRRCDLWHVCVREY